MSMLLFVLLLAFGLMGAGRRLGPGFGLDARESLALGPAFVLIVFWQVGFATFTLGLPLAIATTAATGLLILCAILPVSRPHREELLLAGGFAVAFTWVWALQALIPLYDGGGWAGDWVEHYQRALVFLDRLPPNTVFLDASLLPARPPAWNVLAAMGMSVAGIGFGGFQTLSLFLNLLPILILPLFTRYWFPSSSRTAMLAGMTFVLLNPAFQRNATYTWTRGLTNYLVLCALYLYLKGGYGRNHRLTLASFLVMTTGALAHYSAANYLVALSLHFIGVSIRSRLRWSGIVIVGGLSILLLIPWLGWACNAFGWDGAFLSNSTVQEGTTITLGQRLIKDAYNIVHSFIPTGLFHLEYYRALPQALFNSTMLFYSNSIPGGLSLAVLISIGIGSLRRREHGKPNSPAATWFWLPFLSVAFFLGITTCPGISPWGSANINHQPMILLAVAFTAGVWVERLTAVEAGFVMALAVLECAAFSFLQIASPGYTALQAGATAHFSSTYNASLKQAEGLQFLRDGLGSWLPMVAGLYYAGLALIGGAMLCRQPVFCRKRMTVTADQNHLE